MDLKLFQTHSKVIFFLPSFYFKNITSANRIPHIQNLANRSLVDDVLRKVNGLKPIADELGVPLAQLAIAWCASNPNVSSVITGATKESQVSAVHLFNLLSII